MTNENSGRLLNYYDHIKQSIRVILRTRIGARLMREHFGSLVPVIIDHPNNEVTHMLLLGAIYTALMQWEPRIEIEDVVLTFGKEQPQKASVLIRYSVNKAPQTYTGELI